MRKKIIGGIVVLAIAAVAAFNLNLKSNNGIMSSLSLANVEALAQESGGSQKRCNQLSDPIYYREMCSTNPVKYYTRIGTSYSLQSSDNGTLTRGKSGFTGTITNDCAVWPMPTQTESTAPIVDC